MRPASWNVVRALADQRVAAGVEVEVVAAELGDVHEAVDREAVERDEQPKLVTPLIVPSNSSPTRSCM
jgi:hypothetical protein